EIATCNQCHYIIDPPRINHHLTNAHKLDIPDMDQARFIIQGANLRLHLAVLKGNDNYLSADVDDNDRTTGYEFQTPGYLPGSIPVKGLPIYKGFKCMICLDTCTLKKTSMTSHISRHHPGEKPNYAAGPVQVFYDRSVLRPQLIYVEVQDDQEGSSPIRHDGLGIPGLSEAVRWWLRNETEICLAKNLGCYYLIENVIDFEDLGPWFLKPAAKGFEGLKGLRRTFCKNA
ncbi:hypothetical protein V1505DRAFT_318170, partial [Lipomyces doorenjongii]